MHESSKGSSYQIPPFRDKKTFIVWHQRKSWNTSTETVTFFFLNENNSSVLMIRTHDSVSRKSICRRSRWIWGTLPFPLRLVQLLWQQVTSFPRWMCSLIFFGLKSPLIWLHRVYLRLKQPKRPKASISYLEIICGVGKYVMILGHV